MANMKLLFEIDKKDYDENAERTYRRSSCGIVVKDKNIAMCFVDRHGVYVIPGGGIEEGETKEQAVIREMHEKTGLRIIPESVREYGYVHMAKKGKRYHFDFVDPLEILQENSDRMLAGDAPCLFERERVILLQLIEDGIFE